MSSGKMASGKPPREIDDTERARSMPEAEATALSTIAMTMFLSVLAEAEAARRQEANAIQPEENAPDTARPQISAHVSAAPTEPPAQQIEDQPRDASTDAIPASPPEFTSLAEPARFSETEQQQIDTDVTSLHASQSVGQIATTSGLVPELHAPTPIDAAAWTGMSGIASAPAGSHEPALTSSPGISDQLQDGMVRLSTAISDIGSDLQQHLGSVTSALSDLNTTIASGLSKLGTTISETVADATRDVTDLASSAPTSAAEAVVSGVFGSAPLATADAPDHGLPMLDTAGVVPLPVAAAPLHLGFLGQPHTEGHETQHDGAFSALGVH